MKHIGQTLRSAAALEKARLISPDRRKAIEPVAKKYALALTPAMAELIESAEDPMARQFLPDPREMDSRPEELSDPIGDDAHSPVEGVVHRYPDRVLLKLVHLCAVYCRFCFRRETVGPARAQNLSPAALRRALSYIRDHQEIWEVIVTGGDPLIVSPRRLHALGQQLSAMAHVKVVRFHTRVPVVDPPRVTPSLVRALKASAKAVYVAIHVNHPRELTPAARQACARLVDAGIPLLSQSVLLRGVNDDAATLGELMRALVECRIKPYYLHHGDLAPGTSHFRTSIAEGRDIMRALHGRYSGLCQPAYVLDIPGGFGKSPIGPCYLHDEPGEGTGRPYRIEDFNGRSHSYPSRAVSG